jgi:hypothetical protein
MDFIDYLNTLRKDEINKRESKYIVAFKEYLTSIIMHEYVNIYNSLIDIILENPYVDNPSICKTYIIDDHLKGMDLFLNNEKYVKSFIDELHSTKEYKGFKISIVDSNSRITHITKNTISIQFEVNLQKV